MNKYTVEYTWLSPVLNMLTHEYKTVEARDRHEAKARIELSLGADLRGPVIVRDELDAR